MATNSPTGASWAQSGSARSEKRSIAKGWMLIVDRGPTKSWGLAAAACPAPMRKRRCFSVDHGGRRGITHLLVDSRSSESAQSHRGCAEQPLGLADSARHGTVGIAESSALRVLAREEQAAGHR